jgi:hypothetical protein
MRYFICVLIAFLLSGCVSGEFKRVSSSDDYKKEFNPGFKSNPESVLVGVKNVAQSHGWSVVSVSLQDPITSDGQYIKPKETQKPEEGSGIMVPKIIIRLATPQYVLSPGSDIYVKIYPLPINAALKSFVVVTAQSTTKVEHEKLEGYLLILHDDLHHAVN